MTRSVTDDQDALPIALTQDIYDPAALADAMRAYEERLAVAVLRAEGNQIQVVIQRRVGVPADERVIDEFLNYLLALSIRHKFA